jgi:2'-5' RNA ligase
MSDLLALDVAILPPRDVHEMAVRLGAALPQADFEGLRLDGQHLPHLTLTQQFVRVDEIERVLGRLDAVLCDERPLELRVSGIGATPRSTVWIAIERTPALASLHERLMHALEDVERIGGGPAAFLGGDARLADVAWVAGYRLTSSFLAFLPHITLGHASDPPRLEPFTFEATTVAACHLGRFCTCQRVLRQWTLVRSG